MLGQPLDTGAVDSLPDALKSRWPVLPAALLHHASEAQSACCGAADSAVLVTAPGQLVGVSGPPPLSSVHSP